MEAVGSFLEEGRGVMKGQPGTPGIRNTSEVFLDKGLCDSTVEGVVMGRPARQEKQEVRNVHYRIGHGKLIKIYKGDAVTVDYDVRRLEVPMDRRRWDILEARDHGAHSLFDFWP